MNNTNQKGMVAIMVVLISSAIISAIIIPISFEAYLAQSSTLASQFKEESKLSANSCITALILLLAEFGEYPYQNLQVAGVPNCTIHSVRLVGNGEIIEVESSVGNPNSPNSHTLLRAALDAQTQKLTTLEEVASF